MQIVEQHSPTYHSWQPGSISPRDNQLMANRLHQPLIFSIDDRLAEQHLTRLDLVEKNLKKLDQLPTNVNFNVVLLDRNDISKIEHLDIYPQLIQVRNREKTSRDMFSYVSVVDFTQSSSGYSFTSSTTIDSKIEFIS